MAQKTFRCRLITPEAQVFDQTATAAVIPAWDGSMGILPDRAALVAKLGPGELRLDFADQGGGSKSYFVEGGFARMASNALTILASKAIPADKLSETEAQQELAAVESKAADQSDRRAAEKARADRERASEKLRMARVFKSRGLNR